MNNLYASCFRQLQSLTEAVLERPKPNLDPELLRKVDSFVDGLEIDIDELRSAQWDSNPYGVEEPLYYGSGQYNYDDDEYYTKQLEKALDYIRADGLENYIDVDDNSAQPAVEKYLQDMLDYMN